MSDAQGFQFVTNISREGADKISFWVGDVEQFALHNISLSAKFLIYAFIILVLGMLMVLALRLIFVGDYILGIIIALGVIRIGMLLRTKKAFFTRVTMEYDRAANRLTIEGANFNNPKGSLIIDDPSQLKITVRNLR